MTPEEGGGVELSRRGTPHITLLSPTPGRLDDLYRVWAKELERLRRRERDRPEPERSVTRGSMQSLEALAARVTPSDRAVPNGSSIALLVEHKGASVLLAADAFPDGLVRALRALGRRRGATGPLTLDVVKLSHHGSRANVTVDLFDAVRAEHYVFSTNNSYFNHPNDEAVARVILHGGPRPTLWFNYDTERNRKWAQESLRAKYGHNVRLPEAPLAGVKLELPVRRRKR
jgi:hypothetical protein